VADELEEAGYDVKVQEFDFIAFSQLSPSTLEQTAPGSVVYEENVDYALMSQTDAGDVSGPVAGVDLALADPASSTSGCEPGDFAGFPPGAIALMQRGACDFRVKAENAAAAGAVGAMIFNQGNAPDRVDLFGGTLSSAYQGGIPVVSTSFDLGAEFASIGGLVLHMVVDTERTPTTTSNLLAERAGAAPSDAMVIVVGAHLDSVGEGPGINDNGSGSATILELALQLAKLDIDTDNRIRFAWWGAEESGLVGSQHYVDNLSDDDFAAIALNLNFDMVGSPNFVRFVYDGDGSDTDLVGPPGSDVIEDLFLKYFDLADLETEPTAFDGRSDYGPFIAVGIPAGGLFSGAEGIKTDEQVDVYGGTAGEQYDPCYHEACDTFDNNSNEVLRQFSRASAAVLAVLAFEDLPLVPPVVTSVRTQSAAAAMANTNMEYRGGDLVR
jgi:Zn-dependent M28 family amino/carboxypeptidase